MFRKEFKTMGYIEEVGQREKFCYVSLLKQIEVVLDRGCSKREVMNAILNSIPPGRKMKFT